MRSEYLICPVCRKSLKQDGGCLKCRGGHSFDVARQGYVNLLLRAGRHGDDKAMLAARRGFLEQGYYEPVARLLCGVCGAAGGGVLLDMGCGEGYYTDYIVRHTGLTGLGFDVSKHACAMTARRNEAVTVFTASAFDIPVQASCAECALSVFAPFDAAQVRRVLNKNGRFVRVFPLREHLFELKRAVYDNPRENPEENTGIPGFVTESLQELRFEMPLKSREDIKALFGMTPYVYRTGRAEAERLEKLEGLKCTVAMGIAVYRVGK
ncbi:MAG: methyltransferase domain-containing protein [Firmicutes bacterium]|nr:methyltransferase domain-containing protein [Bacillota bacterium]